MSLFDMPIYINEFLPLTRTHMLDSDDYVYIEVVTQVLMVRWNNAIYVHPDHWDLFKEMFGE
jgi:hypothetical protein